MGVAKNLIFRKCHFKALQKISLGKHSDGQIEKRNVEGLGDNKIHTDNIHELTVETDLVFRLLTNKLTSVIIQS